MTASAFFVISHIIGTVMGAGAATFAEIFVIKALRDGVIDPVEGDFLKTTYTVLRIGLIMVVVSGFGLLFLDRLTGHEQYIYSPKLWVKMTLVVILLLNALALQTRLVPLVLGGAISFTSWYAALILGILRGIPVGYLGILMWYLVSLAVVYVILSKIHSVYDSGV